MNFIINNNIMINKRYIWIIYILIILLFSLVHSEIVLSKEKCKKKNRIIECSEDVCTENTYVYYNYEGYYCRNSKTLILIEEDGYYIDSSITNNGKQTHLIKRRTEIDGEIIFESVFGRNGYYINSGSDHEDYALILCYAKNGCITGYVSNFGYYIPGDGIGIIFCSENMQCKLEKEVSNYYINAGYQRKKYPLIYCRNGRCSGSTQVDGYYLMHTYSNLLKCYNKQCDIILANPGYYLNAENKKYNIMCIRFNANVSCGRRLANVGNYISGAINVLLNCMSEYCQEDELHDGIYRASTTYDLVPNGSQRDSKNTKTMFNLISCQNNFCKELNTTEINDIPICSYSNQICFIKQSHIKEENIKNYLSPGEYCTNENHSKLYLATDIISLKEESNTFHLPFKENCISASKEYNDNYFFISNKIYKIDNGKIAEINKIGFYFINTSINKLVESDNIDDYNNDNINIFYCNGKYCYSWEKPEVITYFTNNSNRIFKYNPHYNDISFAYDHDLKCTYNDDNSCIISENMIEKETENQEIELCVTSNGELVLLLPPKDTSNHFLPPHLPYQDLRETQSINETSRTSSTETTTTTKIRRNNILSYLNNKGNFTVECIKAKNEDEPIYGLTNHLYQLELKSAKIISNNGHYIINKKTNKAIEYDDFKAVNQFLKIYKCTKGQCEPIFQPSSEYFYYDSISQLMVKYHNNNSTWELLTNSGYVYASITPNYMINFIVVQN
ncbi:hypothetical protein H8356DRAFT_1289698 [Neocallimastix lanati (nom. inval.)]|nr:hypothetical protein H8356DRAFT_1289698 [Neocallimastix sp. JGI-2020a]